MDAFVLIANDRFSPSITQRLVADLRCHGLATEPGLIPAETLCQPRFAKDIETLYSSAYAGGRRVALQVPDLAHAADNVVNQIWTSPAIHGLAREVLRSCVGDEGCGAHFVVNVLDNRAAVSDYGVGHFDACYLTFLVPLKVAKPANAGDAGKLRIWPNARRFTQNRILDSIGCRIFTFRPFRERMPSMSLDLQVGWLYAFYGFRSFHQVVPIIDGIQRVTMLIHFGGPRFDRINGVKRRYR